MSVLQPDFKIQEIFQSALSLWCVVEGWKYPGIDNLLWKTIVLSGCESWLLSIAPNETSLSPTFSCCHLGWPSSEGGQGDPRYLLTMHGAEDSPPQATILFSFNIDIGHENVLYTSMTIGLSKSVLSAGTGTSFPVKVYLFVCLFD